nr:ribonuclease H-like YkuK family protein [Brevibacillus fulvus]
MFHSPSKGPLSKEAVFSEIEHTVVDQIEHYEVIVGADSQLRRSSTSFAIVISLIQKGRGGTFFYHTFQRHHFPSLQQRIYSEAFYAVGLASELRQYFKERQIELPIRLHFDIGRNGPTNKFVGYLLSVANTNDFPADIKPDSFCASTIADKFTK